MRIVYIMEILILVLLYYLSQNPNFAESVKPLMGKIKDSEQMLNFLNDLSKFSGAFGNFSGNFSNNSAPNKGADKEDKKEPNSKTCKADEGWQEGNGWKDSEGWKDSDAHSAPQEEKSPQSPTKGIADEFIQSILDSYLKKK